MGSGTLVHVGDTSLGDVLRRGSVESGAYKDIIQEDSIFGAVEALRQSSKEELWSIRTFVLEDRLPLVEASEDYERHMRLLLKGKEPPSHEMRAVLLVGIITQLYKEQGLKVPPIILATFNTENLNRQFPHISGVYDYNGKATANVSNDISRMASAIASKSCGK